MYQKIALIAIISLLGLHQSLHSMDDNNENKIINPFEAFKEFINTSRDWEGDLDKACRYYLNKDKNSNCKPVYDLNNIKHIITSNTLPEDIKNSDENVIKEVISDVLQKNSRQRCIKHEKLPNYYIKMHNPASRWFIAYLIQYWVKAKGLENFLNIPQKSIYLYDNHLVVFAKEAQATTSDTKVIFNLEETKQLVKFTINFGFDDWGKWKNNTETKNVKIQLINCNNCDACKNQESCENPKKNIIIIDTDHCGFFVRPRYYNNRDFFISDEYIDSPFQSLFSGWNGLFSFVDNRVSEQAYNWIFKEINNNKTILYKELDTIYDTSWDGLRYIYQTIKKNVSFNYETIKSLIKQNKDALNFVDTSTGYTPVIYCALKKDYDNLKLLLEYGADPNKRDDRFYTALTHAVKNKDNNIAQLLIDHSATIDYRDLEIADHVMLEFLIQHGADINITKNGKTLLHVETFKEYHDLDKIKILIQYGADINAKTISEVNDYHEQTPLIWSAIKSTITTQYLLEHGANPNEIGTTEINNIICKKTHLTEIIRLKDKCYLDSNLIQSSITLLLLYNAIYTGIYDETILTSDENDEDFFDARLKIFKDIHNYKKSVDQNDKNALVKMLQQKSNASWKNEWLTFALLNKHYDQIRDALDEKLYKPLDLFYLTQYPHKKRLGADNAVLKILTDDEQQGLIDELKKLNQESNQNIFAELIHELTKSLFKDDNNDNETNEKILTDNKVTREQQDDGTEHNDRIVQRFESSSFGAGFAGFL